VKRTGATRALSVTYLQPATALVYGVLLLAEPITWSQVVGLGAILSGVALATRR
jgi:drug/metabolite transporter (DMT)-like permease